MKKNILVLLVVFPVVFLLIAASGSQKQKEENKGKDVFVSAKCNMCHTVESAKIEKTGKSKAPDLSAVGTDHDVKFFEAYLAKKESKNDKKHPVAFKGEPKDLTELAAWLDSMEKSATKKETK